METGDDHDFARETRDSRARAAIIGIRLPSAAAGGVGWSDSSP